MTAQSINGSVPVDFFYEGVEVGASGWFTKVEPSADHSRICGSPDVTQAYVRVLADVEWKPALRMEAMPARYQNPYNGVGGTHDISFAGASNTRLYVALNDGILRTDDFADTWTATAIDGLNTQSGFEHQRIFSRAKGLNHPTDQNFYFCSFQHHGMVGTRDGGATRDNMSWLPRPSLPAARPDRGEDLDFIRRRFTISARNPDNVNEIAFCPSGEGVWVSTDNGVTGTKISNGNIISCTDMEWRNGYLYVAKAVDVPTPADSPSFPNPGNNLYRWSQATGWKHYDTGMHFNDNTPFGVQFIVPDPRNANWWLLLGFTSAYIHTKNLDDPSTYKQSDGTGESVQYMRAGPFVNCKTRARPVIARKYRNGGGGYACSKPVTVGPWLYWPLGYGPLRTPWADFPTEAGGYFDAFANWPVMEEDTAGIEELVAMHAVAGAKMSFGLSQDFPFSAIPTREVGHQAVYEGFPGIGQLSTGVDGQISPVDSDFMVFAAFKNGPFVGFSKDGGVTRKMCPNQPHVTHLAQGGPGGAVVPGPDGQQMVIFPSHSPPEFTSDLGNTPWQNLNVYLEDGTLLDLNPTLRFNKTGFHTPGSQYGVNRMATIDEDGTYWAMNIGAGRDGINPSTGLPYPENDWEGDGQGWGGIYRMTQADFPNLRRVSAGRPISWGNVGYFRRNVINVPGSGKVMFLGNDMDGDGFGNGFLIYDKITKQRTIINNPYNFQDLDVGAPFEEGGPLPVYGMGYYRTNINDVSTAKYGIWITFDLFDTPPIGPFNIRPQGRPGQIIHFAANRVEPGTIVCAMNGLGHVVGKLRQA